MRWVLLLALGLVGLWWRFHAADHSPAPRSDGAGLNAGHDPLDLKRGSIPGNRDGTPGQTEKIGD